MSLDWVLPEHVLEQLAWSDAPVGVVCEQLLGEAVYLDDGEPLLDLFAELRHGMIERAESHGLTVAPEVHQRAHLAHAPYDAMRARLDEAGIEIVLPQPGLEAVAFPKEGVVGRATLRFTIRR